MASVLQLPSLIPTKDFFFLLDLNGVTEKVTVEGLGIIVLQ